MFKRAIDRGRKHLSPLRLVGVALCSSTGPFFYLLNNPAGKFINLALSFEEVCVESTALFQDPLRRQRN